jgi:hypothetical protein
LESFILKRFAIHLNLLKIIDAESRSAGKRSYWALTRGFETTSGFLSGIVYLVQGFFFGLPGEAKEG